MPPQDACNPGRDGECLTNITNLTELPQVTSDSSVITTVLSTVFSILAAVAVLIIIVQAIKFILSSGEPDKAASARNGIIYAVIGLALALSANLIVLFVLRDVF